MPVTIREVAKLAGVAPSTVSRVIANNPKITDETKEKVYIAMKELNYRPNAIARSLANNRTNTLGLIIPNSDENLFSNPFFIEVMRGISIYSQKNDFHIMYTYTSEHEEEIEFIEGFIRSGLVDGVILMTTMENDKSIEFLKSREFPFVVIGRPEMTDNILWVDNDNFQATYNMVSRLVNDGYSKIAFIGGKLKYNFSKDRYEGYRRALAIRGLDENPKFVNHVDEFNMISGYEACKEILSTSSPDSIVTTDDLLGFGAVKYLKEIGNTDIRVTGFNNIAFNTYQDIGITSVDINSDELGYNAARLLIESLKGELKSNHFIVDTKIVER